MSPGDRILVTMPRSAPREGEYVEDRGRKCKVLLDGDTETCVVLRERCKAVVARVVSVNHAARTIVMGSPEASTRAGEMALRVAAHRAVPKPPKRLRSDRYLAFVRKHACCAPACHTMYDRVEAHHFGPHGLSVKCDDFRTVPLCHRCHHAEFHTHGVLRGCNREETERVFMREMRGLLMEWFATERDGGELDVVIVDALIAHLRESQT